MKLSSIELGEASVGQEKVLSRAQSTIGFVPNLIKKMANAPVIAEAYLTVGEIFSKSSFSAIEQQLILLTVSRYHECAYCMAAHSAIAKMQSVPKEIIEAIRNDEDLSNPKLAALRNLTENMVATRGNPDESVLKEFLEVGYDDSQVLEIILGISMKILSNYTNHVAETELDEMMEPERWHVNK